MREDGEGPGRKASKQRDSWGERGKANSVSFQKLNYVRISDLRGREAKEGASLEKKISGI